MERERILANEKSRADEARKLAEFTPEQGDWQAQERALLMRIAFRNRPQSDTLRQSLARMFLIICH